MNPNLGQWKDPSTQTAAKDAFTQSTSSSSTTSSKDALDPLVAFMDSSPIAEEAAAVVNERPLDVIPPEEYVNDANLSALISGNLSLVKTVTAVPGKANSVSVDTVNNQFLVKVNTDIKDHAGGGVQLNRPMSDFTYSDAVLVKVGVMEGNMTNAHIELRDSKGNKATYELLGLEPGAEGYYALRFENLVRNGVSLDEPLTLLIVADGPGQKGTFSLKLGREGVLAPGLQFVTGSRTYAFARDADPSFSLFSIYKLPDSVIIGSVIDHVSPDPNNPSDRQITSTTMPAVSPDGRFITVAQIYGPEVGNPDGLTIHYLYTLDLNTYEEKLIPLSPLDRNYDPARDAVTGLTYVSPTEVAVQFKNGATFRYNSEAADLSMQGIIVNGDVQSITNADRPLEYIRQKIEAFHGLGPGTVQTFIYTANPLNGQPAVDVFYRLTGKNGQKTFHNVTLTFHDDGNFKDISITPRNIQQNQNPEPAFRVLTYERLLASNPNLKLSDLTVKSLKLIGKRSLKLKKYQIKYEIKTAKGIRNLTFTGQWFPEAANRTAGRYSIQSAKLSNSSIPSRKELFGRRWRR